jgi:hypothetical protein
MTSLKTKIYLVIFAALAILAATSNIYNWYSAIGHSVPVNTWVKPETPKVIREVKYVKVPSPPEIIVLDKREAVKKLELPDWIKNDINKQVPAAVETPPYEGKTQVAAVFDTRTGSTDFLVRQIPLSFFALISEQKYFVQLGYSTDLNLMLGAGFQYDFLRIKKTKMGFVGEVQGSTDDLKGIAWLRMTFR